MYLLLSAFIVIFSITKEMAGRGQPQRWHWSKDCKWQITITETPHCQGDGANRLSCPFLQQHKHIKFRMSVCYNVQNSLYVCIVVWSCRARLLTIGIMSGPLCCYLQPRINVTVSKTYDNMTLPDAMWH